MKAAPSVGSTPPQENHQGWLGNLAHDCFWRVEGHKHGCFLLLSNILFSDLNHVNYAPVLHVFSNYSMAETKRKLQWSIMIYQLLIFTGFWKLKKFLLSSTSHYIRISQLKCLFLLFPSGGPSMCMTSNPSSHFCTWRKASQSSHYTTSTLPGQTSGYYFVRPSDRFKFLLLFSFMKLLLHTWSIIALWVFQPRGQRWWKRIGLLVDTN